MLIKLSSLLGDSVGFFGGAIKLIVNFFSFMIFGLLYTLFRGLSLIIDFVEMLFKEAAGIGQGEDWLLTLIKNRTITSTFYTIIALSLVILIIFTIVALVKQEFNLSMDKYSKSAIFGRALKSLANFFVIPIVSILAIYGTNVLVKTVNDMLFGSNSGLSVYAFKAGINDANRARNDSAFAAYLIRGDWRKSEPKHNVFSKVVGFDSGDIVNVAEDGSSINTTHQEAVASLIDYIFTEESSFIGKTESSTFELTTQVNNATIKTTVTVSECKEILSKNTYQNYTFKQQYDREENSFIDWCTSGYGYPNYKLEKGTYGIITKYSPKTSASAVNYYYELSSFNWILGIGSAVLIGWTMLSVCLVLIKRVIELVFMFLIAPGMSAIAPLDGGAAEKNWRSNFTKRLLATIGPIITFNLYFSLQSAIKTLSLSIFTGLFAVLFDVVILYAALGVIKGASSLISQLLGVDDLVASSGDAMKKATSTKLFKGATAVGATAFKGAAALAKGSKNAVTGFNTSRKQITQLKKDEELQSQLEKDYNDKSGRLTMMFQDEAADPAEQSALFTEVEEARKNLDYQKSVVESNPAFQRKNRRAQHESNKGAADELIAEEENRVETIQKEIDNRKTSLKGKNSINDEVRLKREIADLESKKSEAESNISYMKGESKLEKESINADKIPSIKSFGSGLASGFTSEFGKNADKTSLSAWIAGKADNIPIVKSVLGSKSTFNGILSADMGSISARFKESFFSMFGDGAGGKAAKFIFDPGSHKSLYQTDKEKQQSDNKKAEITAMKTREEYARQQDEANNRKKELDFLKSVAAYDSGKGSEYKKLLEQLASAKERGLNSEIKAATIKVDKFESANNINKRAETMSNVVNGGNSSDKDAIIRKIDEIKRSIGQEIRSEAQKEAQEKAKKSAAENTMTMSSILDTLVKINANIDGLKGTK